MRNLQLKVKQIFILITIHFSRLTLRDTLRFTLLDNLSHNEIAKVSVHRFIEQLNIQQIKKISGNTVNGPALKHCE